MLAHEVGHAVGQRTVFNQQVTVVAVFGKLVQIHIVQTGAAVKHQIIEHIPLQMQYTEQFAGLHRHAVNRNAAVMQRRLLLIPGRIAA